MAHLIPSTSGKRILVVDDDVAVSGSLKRLLEFDGHHVQIVPAAKEALALLGQAAFDLIITDYEMPGMKGDKLAAAIKAVVPGQPILLISAYGERLQAEGCSLSSIDLLLTKPFAFRDLRQAISKLLPAGA